MNAERRPKQRVLIVDDDRRICALMTELLGKRYDCLSADSIAGARTQLAAAPVDLCLCDLDLGGESGLDLLAELDALSPETVALLVTATDDPQVGERAIALGAYGYLVKPFRYSELQSAVKAALDRRDRERASSEAHDSLERTLYDNAVALGRSRNEAERRLGEVIELRDYATGAHVNRVAELTVRLAEAAGLDAPLCARLRAAVPLHDIGKLAIPDSILFKPGPLSNAEWEIMRTHAKIGWRVLHDSSSPTVRLAATIAYTHHERWDGAGYPRGLAGDDIPLPGRLVAICDAYDALTNVRPYRPALTSSVALARMLDSPGHFDPPLLALFSRVAAATPADQSSEELQRQEASLA